MKKRVMLLFASLTIICLVACESTRVPDGVYLTDEKAISLLPPSAVGAPFEDYQLLIGSYGDEEFMMEAYLYEDEHKLDMTVLSTSGQTICTIIWDGENVTFSSPFIPAGGIKAEYIVADLQLATYDQTAVRYAVESAGLQLSIDEIDGGHVLTIADDGTPVWTCVRQGGYMKVENPLRGYRYEVTSLL